MSYNFMVWRVLLQILILPFCSFNIKRTTWARNSADTDLRNGILLFFLSSATYFVSVALNLKDIFLLWWVSIQPMRLVIFLRHDNDKLSKKFFVSRLLFMILLGECSFCFISTLQYPEAWKATFKCSSFFDRCFANSWGTVSENFESYSFLCCTTRKLRPRPWKLSLKYMLCPLWLPWILPLKSQIIKITTFILFF